MSMSQSVPEGNQGRKGIRGHGGTLLTGLLSLTFSGCFLIQSRATWPEMALPVVSWAFSLQLLIKETIYSYAWNPI